MVNPNQQFVNKNSILDSQEQSEKNQNTWNGVVAKYSSLKDKSQELEEEHNNLSNMAETYKSERMLKMQRQDDARAQIEHDSNVIVFCGIGLAVILIFAIVAIK